MLEHQLLNIILYAFLIYLGHSATINQLTVIQGTLLFTDALMHLEEFIVNLKNQFVRKDVYKGVAVDYSTLFLSQFDIHMSKHTTFCSCRDIMQHRHNTISLLLHSQRPP